MTNREGLSAARNRNSGDDVYRWSLAALASPATVRGASGDGGRDEPICEILAIASRMWRNRKIRSRSGDTQGLGEDRVAKRRKIPFAKDDVYVCTCNSSCRAASQRSEISFGISTNASMSLRGRALPAL